MTVKIINNVGASDSGESKMSAFFNKLGPKVKAKVDKLVQLGATFQVEWQALKINHKGLMLTPLMLTANSNAVVKGSLTAAELTMVVHEVDSYLTSALALLNAPPPEVADSEQWKAGLGPWPASTGVVATPHTVKFGEDGSMLVDQLIPSAPEEKDWKYVPDTGVKVSIDYASAAKTSNSSKTLKKKTGVVSNKPSVLSTKSTLADALDAAQKAAEPLSQKINSSMPVKLASASVLGQKVKGTSDSSVYRVCAIGPRIRMAVRVQPGNLSVRVEGAISDTERSALIGLGFKDSGHYLSSHFKLEQVVPQRVLGCLFFHEGLELTSKISSIDEVK